VYFEEDEYDDPPASTQAVEKKTVGHVLLRTFGAKVGKWIGSLEL
jgi:hypothetical protein